jgi:NitT/TauT family transport system permease protein
MTTALQPAPPEEAEVSESEPAPVKEQPRRDSTHSAPPAPVATNGQRPSRVPLRVRSVGVKLVFAAMLIGIWQLLTWLKVAPPYVFPGPVDVLKSLVEMAGDGTLLISIRQSMGRMLVGYSISVVIGLSIGILAARSWLFKETFGSLILSLQSLPSVCWLPLALIWVGINEGAILAVVILGATFSIAVATEGAIRNIPPIYQKVGRVLGARGVTFAKDVLFFAALPELIGGLKLGWTFAWRSLMAAELIRQDVFGVGRLLETGRQFNAVDQMIAAMVVILAIGLTVDTLVFGTLERKIRMRWGLARA